MAIHVLTIDGGAYQENAYAAWLEGRDDCVIVDPGGNLPALRASIGGRKLAAVLLTHGHFDHILAAKPLADEHGCPVYIHEADIEMLNDPDINAYDPFASDLPAPTDLSARPYGENLSAAGMDFSVLHTPGHSKGSACLYLAGEKTLFSGDTLFMAGFGRTDLHGGSPMQMRESLKRLFALPADVAVYPGHGPATTIGAERARYRL